MSGYEVDLGWGLEGLPDLASEPDDAREAWHEFTGGGLPVAVRLRIARDEQGRFVCTGLLLARDDGVVTTETLRSIPLGQLMTHLNGLRVKLAAEPKEMTIETFEDFDRAMELMTIDVIDDAAGAAPAPKRTRGRRGPSDAELGQLMRTYAQACTDSLPGAGRTSHQPVAATAKHEMKDRSTVHRWLKLAAQRGITGQEDPS